ncbi:MAG TPA: S41 family peptidase [Thermoflexia bacterium]|nr:S41 family peptidase [Thermoflexia bacterium]
MSEDRQLSDRNTNTEPTSDRQAALFGSLVLVLVFLLFFAGGFATHRMLNRRSVVTAAAWPMTVFWEAWDIVEQDFYGEVPPPKVRVYGAIRGSLAVLNDPYTVFLEPQTGEVERDRLSGSYGGIGVDIWRDSEDRIVLNPYPGSPAEVAGVRAGDFLLAVDGHSVLTATVDEVRARLHGEVGTPVVLTLSRPPTPTHPFVLTIVRQEIQVPSVSYRLLDQDPSIGYLQITSFTERTPQEVEEALRSLLDGGATRLILDLRDNGGGLIQPAVDVGDQFLDGGIILYEVRRGRQERAFRARRGGLATEPPLVVLVNGSTASASEMIAGSLQVQGRATLIGEPTYGKGSVQLIFTLSDGSSLHVTSAIWLLPDHRPLPETGLTPDIRVSPGEGLGDAQLDRAIRYLQRGE